MSFNQHHVLRSPISNNCRHVKSKIWAIIPRDINITSHFGDLFLTIISQFLPHTHTHKHTHIHTHTHTHSHTHTKHTYTHEHTSKNIHSYFTRVIRAFELTKHLFWWVERNFEDTYLSFMRRREIYLVKFIKKIVSFTILEKEIKRCTWNRVFLQLQCVSDI